MMRERLINLIASADEECKHTKDCKICSGYGKGSSCMNYHIADYLIANGVVVLPCKVEDEVWYVENGFCFNRQISHGRVMHFDIRNMWGLGLTYNVAIQPDKNAFDSRLFFVMFDGIGKEIFLSREEAEAKLKGDAKE